MDVCLFLFLFSHSVMSDSANPGTVSCQAPLSLGFLSKNTGPSCQFLLQGIFPTQESNPCLLQVSCIAGRFFYCWVTGETTRVCTHILFHILFHYGLSQESEYSFLLLYSSTLLLKILSLLIIKIHGMSYISNGSISRKKAFIKTEVWKWRQTTLAKKEERTGVLSYPTLVQSGIWKTNTLVFVDMC